MEEPEKYFITTVNYSVVSIVCVKDVVVDSGWLEYIWKEVPNF